MKQNTRPIRYCTECNAMLGRMTADSPPFCGACGAPVPAKPSDKEAKMAREFEKPRRPEREVDENDTTN